MGGNCRLLLVLSLDSRYQRLRPGSQVMFVQHVDLTLRQQFAFDQQLSNRQRGSLLLAQQLVDVRLIQQIILDRYFRE